VICDEHTGIFKKMETNAGKRGKEINKIKKEGERSRYEKR
jgi:hypothetical protein